MPMGTQLAGSQEWLQACDQVGIVLVDAMLELSDRYSTQLALDESVATLDQLQASYQQGWRGFL